MSNNVLNILISISASIIGILAFADEIAKFRSLKFIKSLRFKILIFLFASILGVWASVKKDSNTDLQNKIEKNKAIIEQLKRDSTNRVYTNESNSKIVMSFTEGLAKYGLKFDAAQQRIEKLVRDSTKRNVTIVENPELSLCPGDGLHDIYYRSDTLFLKLNFCSAKSISIVDSLKITILVSDGDIHYFLLQTLKIVIQDFLVADKGNQIETNSKTIQQIHYPHAPIGNMLYVWVYGTYKNQDRSKTMSIDVIYGFDIKNNQYGSATPIPNRVIRNFIKINKNNKVKT